MMPPEARRGRPTRRAASRLGFTANLRPSGALTDGSTRGEPGMDRAIARIVAGRRSFARMQTCGRRTGRKAPSALAPGAEVVRGTFMASAREAGTSRVGGWLFDQPYLLLALTSLFWAGNTVLGRFIVGHVPPITLSFIRWTGACLILLPFAAPHLRRDWPAIRQHAGVMTLLAFTGFAIYNTLAYYGLQYTTAINGLLLQSVAPLFVAMWTFV